jgi:hypothetical protein
MLKIANITRMRNVHEISEKIQVTGILAMETTDKRVL